MFHFLQVDTTATAETLSNAIEQGNQAAGKELALSEIIFSGGPIGQTIMIVIFIMLFLTIYLYLERFLAIKKVAKVDENFMAQIKMFLSQGKIDQAKMLCANTNSPVSRLIAKGISRIGKPLQDINTAIENAGKLEVYKMEKNINLLATLSGAGPMTGFFGYCSGNGYCLS
jgi:biopolymer transport protein ExbB